jgi:ferredoxin
MLAWIEVMHLLLEMKYPLIYSFSLLLKILQNFVQILNMFDSDTLSLCDVDCVNACAWCMLVCLLCVITFPAIESNDECAEEDEVYEYQDEED